eukprot:m.113431 g.113431  ORF g.113431 m.113431 type:complete len:823 (+) comp28270_c0_seq1:137-2605(+)
MKSSQAYVLLGAIMCLAFVLIATRTHGNFKAGVSCPRGGYCGPNEKQGPAKTVAGPVNSGASNSYEAAPTTPWPTASAPSEENAPTTPWPTASAPSEDTQKPPAPTTPWPTASAPSSDEEDKPEEIIVESEEQIKEEEHEAIERDIDGRLHNPYLKLHLSKELENTWLKLEKERKERSAFIAQEWGSWCPSKDGPAKDCWIETGKNTGKYNFLKTCTCDQAHWANQSNWDHNWRITCKAQNELLENTHPFPEELKPVFELNFKSPGINKYGALDPYFAPAFSSGSSNTGPLNFNVMTVRDHFLKLRAGLVLFYQGTKRVENIHPIPEEATYSESISTMADRFAGAFIHGGTIVVGVLGDSTAAGMDNCFFDAWSNGLWRQLRPLFQAAKVDFEVRDGGHNGGKKTNPQIACAKSIAGADADFIILSAPFVKPSGGDVTFEDFIRRSLISGAIPSIHDNLKPEMSNQYAKYGLTWGHTINQPPSQTGIGEQGFVWYPSLGKSNWGRIDDGICHAFGTRSGSSSVFTRNWHQGPLGHQYTQDTIAFMYAEAVVKALDEIAVALKASNNDLAPLKKRWPRRQHVTAKQLGKPVSCLKGTSTNAPLAQLCGKDGAGIDTPAANGLATCVLSLDPNYFASWKDLMMTSGAPVWEAGASDNGPAFSIAQQGPFSRGDFYTCAKGNCDLQPTPSSQCAASCTEERTYRAETPETIRNDRQCEHNDSWVSVASNGGWATFRIPENTMKTGVISICSECSNLRVMVEANGIAKKEFTGISWSGDDFGSKEQFCATVTRDLGVDKDWFTSNELHLGVKCSEKGKTLNYLNFQ